MNTAEKLAQMAEWLRQVNLVVMDGGYPDVVAIVGGHIIVASADEGKPSLEIIDEAKALCWHDNVAQYLTEHDVDPESRDIADAVWDSEPKE